jgi:transposase
VDIWLAQEQSLTHTIHQVESLLQEALADHPVVSCLQRLPGFGFLTASAFLAEVGEVSRFRRSRHLVSYLGLAPRVRSSGDRVRYGSLTKEGPPLLRSYLVQAARGAVLSPGPCQELFLRVSQRSGSKSARVAVARKLASMAFHTWIYEGGIYPGVAPTSLWP